MIFPSFLFSSKVVETKRQKTQSVQIQITNVIFLNVRALMQIYLPSLQLTTYFTYFCFVRFTIQKTVMFSIVAENKILSLYSATYLSHSANENCIELPCITWYNFHWNILHTAYVAHMAEMRNGYNILFQRLKGRDHSKDLGVESRIILEQILGKWGLGCGLDSYGSG
jgi:hypothetical protein